MLQTLVNIYNTLGLVETKGQSTIYMGAVLSTLKDLIDKEYRQDKTQEENNTTAQVVFLLGGGNF